MISTDIDSLEVGQQNVNLKEDMNVQPSRIPPIILNYADGVVFATSSGVVADGFFYALSSGLVNISFDRDIDVATVPRVDFTFGTKRFMLRECFPQATPVIGPLSIEMNPIVRINPPKGKRSPMKVVRSLAARFRTKPLENLG